jgi:hypothetical protein
MRRVGITASLDHGLPRSVGFARSSISGVAVLYLFACGFRLETPA